MTSGRIRTRGSGHSDNVTTTGGVDSASIADLAPKIRRVLLAAGGAEQDVLDLTQETVARLLEVRSRLDPATLEPYALRVSTNLLASRRRSEDIERRHRPRLAEPVSHDDSSEHVLREESAQAVRAALDALPASTRDSLTVHETGSNRSIRPAEASRRHRARARFRLEYLLALRRERIPPECHSVLMSISARDTRQQSRLGADAHVRDCARCRGLAVPLAQRRRRLFGVGAPFVGGLALLRCVRSRSWGHATTDGVAAGVATVALVTITPAVSNPLSAPQPASPSAVQAVPASASTTVGTVLFSEGSAVVDPAAQRMIRAAAVTLRRDRIQHVAVTGHTDSTGSAAGNATLSQERGKAVASMLVALIPGLHVDVRQVASSEPAAPNDTDSHRRLNRSVTIDELR